MQDTALAQIAAGFGPSGWASACKRLNHIFGEANVSAITAIHVVQNLHACCKICTTSSALACCIESDFILQAAICPYGQTETPTAVHKVG